MSKVINKQDRTRGGITNMDKITKHIKSFAVALILILAIFSIVSNKSAFPNDEYANSKTSVADLFYVHLFDAVTDQGYSVKSIWFTAEGETLCRIDDIFDMWVSGEVDTETLVKAFNRIRIKETGVEKAKESLPVRYFEALARLQEARIYSSKSESVVNVPWTNKHKDEINGFDYWLGQSRNDD